MNNDAIDRFLERVRQAQRSRSREIRMTVEEAAELSVNIALLLGTEKKLLGNIIELQKQQTVIGDISMDGGGFK
jgi:hypothetical protein